MTPLDLIAKTTPAGWFRPWMIWAAAVAALVALLGVQTLRLAGAEKNLSDAKAQHAEAMRQIAEATTTAMDAARKTETGLRADLDKIQAKAAKEQEDAKSREDTLVERVRTGERRLSIAAACPASPSGIGVRAPASGVSWSGVSRAEIDPAAADRIIAITRDGDRNTRERNACVEAYEAVRQRLNAAAAE